ncbi:MAG: DUF2079 domain-containing protein, partial [Acidimicrobiales bacterium]
MTELGAESPVTRTAPSATQLDGGTATPTAEGAPTRRRGAPLLSRASRSDWLGWAGLALLFVQGVGMLVWSTLLWRRFALTSDYAIYHQAWWLIAHGHLDPFSTFLGDSFWQNHSEFIMWPLALLGVLFPHGPVLLYLQDVAFVSADMVAWQWMRTAANRLPNWHSRAILIAGLVVLLADPWSWWAISFDFHMELVGSAFVLAAAYELSHKGRRRAWVWVGLGLVCGAVTATYIAGLGIAVLLVSRHWRRRGLLLLAIGTGWTLLVTLVHGDQGAPLGSLYGYLGAKNQNLNPSSNATIAAIVHNVLTHPLSVPTALWAHRVDVWANLAPSGLLGVFDPWALGSSL